MVHIRRRFFVSITIFYENFSSLPLLLVTVINPIHSAILEIRIIEFELQQAGLFLI